MRPWTSYLKSLSLSFPISKMEITAASFPKLKWGLDNLAKHAKHLAQLLMPCKHSVGVNTNNKMLIYMGRPLANAGDVWVQFLGREDPLEKEMATHSSFLAWRISWTESLDRNVSDTAERPTFTFTFLVGNTWRERKTGNILLLLLSASSGLRQMPVLIFYVFKGLLDGMFLFFPHLFTLLSFPPPPYFFSSLSPLCPEKELYILDICL